MLYFHFCILLCFSLVAAAAFFALPFLCVYALVGLFSKRLLKLCRNLTLLLLLAMRLNAPMFVRFFFLVFDQTFPLQTSIRWLADIFGHNMTLLIAITEHVKSFRIISRAKHFIQLRHYFGNRSIAAVKLQISNVLKNTRFYNRVK